MKYFILYNEKPIYSDLRGSWCYDKFLNAYKLTNLTLKFARGITRLYLKNTKDDRSRIKIISC